MIIWHLMSGTSVVCWYPVRNLATRIAQLIGKCYLHTPRDHTRRRDSFTDPAKLSVIHHACTGRSAFQAPKTLKLAVKKRDLIVARYIERPKGQELINK